MSAYFRRRITRDRPVPPVMHRRAFEPHRPVEAKIKLKKSDKRQAQQLEFPFALDLLSYWRVR